MDSGTMAIRMPVTDELIQRSPREIAENGIANSTNANAQIAVLRLVKPRSAPRRQAIGTSIAAAIATRLNATSRGATSCTAILMKKYGKPQMMPSAAKAVHARQLTRSPYRCLTVRYANRDRRYGRPSLVFRLFRERQDRKSVV